MQPLNPGVSRLSISMGSKVKLSIVCMPGLSRILRGGRRFMQTEADSLGDIFRACSLRIPLVEKKKKNSSAFPPPNWVQAKCIPFWMTHRWNCNHCLEGNIEFEVGLMLKPISSHTCAAVMSYTRCLKRWCKSLGVPQISNYRWFKWTATAWKLQWTQMSCSYS